MPCATMRGHAWPDTTTNIALRYNTNLAMLDKIWSCSARQFWCCQGAVRLLSCCQGAVENDCNDDTCTTEKSRRLDALGYCSEREKQTILWDGAVVGLGLRCLAAARRRGSSFTGPLVAGEKRHHKHSSSAHGQR